MAEALAPSAGWRGDVRVVGWISAGHFLSHYYQLVLPPLFPILLLEFGTGYTELGLMMSLMYATSGLAQTPAGILVDRFGPHRVLFAGLALLAGGIVLCGLATSYWMMTAALMLSGLGNSVFHPADFAILSGRVSDQRLGRAFSMHMLGGTLGWAAAPGSILLLVEFLPWRIAVCLVGGIGLAFTALMWLQRHDFAPTAERRAKTAPRPSTGNTGAGLSVVLAPAVLLCLAYFILLSLALTGIQTFLPTTLSALHDTPLTVAGAALTAFLLGSGAGTIVGGLLADRYGAHDRIVAFGLSAAAAAILVVHAVGLAAAGLMAVVALAGFASGMTMPSRDMLVRAAAPEGAHGRVFGFTYSGLEIGGALAPTAVGALLDGGLEGLVLPSVAVILLLTVIAALSVRLGHRRVAG